MTDYQTCARSAFVRHLSQRGAVLDEHGHAVAFAERAAGSEGPLLYPLTQYSVIRISGSDGAAFLQSQLSNDVSALSPGRAQLSSYCTPQGRVLATLLLWKVESTILTLLSADLAAAVRQRLARYVLRADVGLALADDLVLLGIGELRPGHVPEGLFVDGVPTEMEVRAFDGAGQAIGLIGDNVLLALRGENAPAVWDALARWGQPYPTAEWDLRMIEAGLPMVTAATQDQFVPQMLNLEKLGAVSFDKGCYPGQEIVARSQYRGEVKRRLFRLRLPQGRVAPGEEIFADGIAQSAGSVINAAAQGEGAALLAVLRLEAVDRPLHLRTPDGPVLVRVP